MEISLKGVQHRREQNLLLTSREGDLLMNFELHHRMNLPNSVIGQPGSIHLLEQGRCPKKRFPDHGDDWRFVDCEFSRGLSAQRESHRRPTKDRLA